MPKTKFNELIERRELMVNYLKMKVEEQDWHAVADAAMDLREIDTEIRIIKSGD